MGGKRCFATTNGREKEKVAISLCTIPEGKRSSVKSYAESH